MLVTASVIAAMDTGLEVVDIHGNAEFAARRLHVRNAAAQMVGMQRIAHAFVEEPETILQVLAKAAVELCGADSAGISVERPDHSDDEFYHWVATAGSYNGFLNAVLPRYPSACGVCLERDKPQLFRVHQRFFDIMGIQAPIVTDGILLPWKVEQTRGTIFIMAHTRTEAFDMDDYRMMQTLADFASMGVRQQRQQQHLLQQAGNAGAVAMANDLAHRINNPLQSLTNVLYLAAEGHHGAEAQEIGRQASKDVASLSGLVAELLALPYGKP